MVRFSASRLVHAGWKVAKIVTIIKKDDKIQSKITDLSLLSSVCEPFESYLYYKIFAQVKKRISPWQHSFFVGTFIQTNLICFTQYIASTLDILGQVICIYTDF